MKTMMTQSSFSSGVSLSMSECNVSARYDFTFRFTVGIPITTETAEYRVRTCTNLLVFLSFPEQMKSDIVFNYELQDVTDRSKEINTSSECIQCKPIQAQDCCCILLKQMVDSCPRKYPYVFKYFKHYALHGYNGLYPATASALIHILFIKLPSSAFITHGPHTHTHDPPPNVHFSNMQKG